MPKRVATAHKAERSAPSLATVLASEEEMVDARKPGDVVLRQAGDDVWQLVGDVDRRPGLTARVARAQAILDATGGETTDVERFRGPPAQRMAPRSRLGRPREP